MPNLYVSLNSFKGQGAANLALGSNDARLVALIDTISRQAENYCGHHFYSLTQIRYFSGNGLDILPLPDNWDLIAITTLKEDEDGDSTFETTWAAADYHLYPYDAQPTGDIGRARPYHKLEVNQATNGTKGSFSIGQRRFELTGKWGYCESTEATGATINEGAQYSSSDTTLTVSDGTKISIGDTLMIETEQIYVKDQANVGGADFTVTRGINGTTAAAHADATAISRILYPLPVVEAVYMQASRLWTRRASGFANNLGFAETGIVRPWTGLDRDVKELLDQYRLLVVA